MKKYKKKFEKTLIKEWKDMSNFEKASLIVLLIIVSISLLSV